MVCPASSLSHTIPMLLNAFATLGYARQSGGDGITLHQLFFPDDPHPRKEPTPTCALDPLKH